MDRELEFGECYICLEDTPLLSQCLCNNRFLCENCMEKLRIYKYKKCTVCHAYYPKRLDQTIDIQIPHIQIPLEDESITGNYACTPSCLRPRSESNYP